jgi:hypothetical protein
MSIRFPTEAANADDFRGEKPDDSRDTAGEAEKGTPDPSQQQPRKRHATRERRGASEDDKASSDKDKDPDKP